MSLHIAPVVSALGFTSGCVAIHALREHSARLGNVLAPVAIVLLATAVTVALVQLTAIEALDLQGLDVERQLSQPE